MKPLPLGGAVGAEAADDVLGDPPEFPPFGGA